MAESKGIRRFLELVLDRARAQKTQREAQDALNKGTDPRKAQQNLSHIDRAFDGIGRAALKIGGILAGVFALNRIKAFAVSAVKEFGEAEAVWSRLGATLSNVGVSLESVRAELEGTAAAMADTTTMGDEEFADTLNTLVQLTGDYSGSLQKVQLVADLAAGANIDYEQAATLVGKAMAGNTMQLTRMFPALKGHADILGELAKIQDGQALKQRGTWAGALGALSESWHNLKEEIGRAITEAGGGTSVLETLTGVIRGMTTWIVEHQSDIDAFAKSVASIADSIASTLKNIPQWWTNLAAGRRRTDDGLTPLERETLSHDMGGKTAAATPPGGTPPKGLPVWSPDGSADDASHVRAAKTGVDLARDTVKAYVAALEESAKEIEGAQEVFEAKKPPADLLGIWLDTNDMMLRAGQDAALGVMDAWQRTFEAIMFEGATVGEAIETLFSGMATAGLRALAQRAAGEVLKNAALALEAVGIGLLGDPKGFAAAASFGLAAAKWALVGAVAGAGASGLGGRGGGGVPNNSIDRAGRGVDGSRAPGAEIHIYIDPLNPNNPAYQRNIAETSRAAKERFGENSNITIYPAQARQ